MERIAVLTSGGDAPGMNACIRAVVRSALNRKMDVYGVERGYAGLVKGEINRLSSRSVSDMIHKGGTFLNTARCPEFKDIEVQRQAVEALAAYGKVMKCVSDASGIIPQIAVIDGICGGSSAVIASMFDFAITIKDVSKLYVNSPFVVGKEVGSSDFAAHDE